MARSVAKSAGRHRERKTRSDGERSRTAILDEAARLATVEGIGGLSLSRLADQVGMSKSGLIRHFGTKEGLQLAALEGAIERFTTEVWEPVAEEPAGLTRLRALCGSWLSHLRRGVFPGGCFLSAASLEFDDRPGLVRNEVAAQMSRWLGVLARDVEIARVAGELPASTDPEQMAFELNAIFMGTNWSHRLLRDDRAFDRAERGIARLLT